MLAHIPRAWRCTLTLKPDAFVITGNDDYLDSWFVELDRATEPVRRIADKCKLYWRYWQSGREQSEHQVFPTVLFVVPTERRKTQLVDYLAGQPAERWQLFQVVTADLAADAMASGELVTNHTGEEVTS